MTKGIGSFIGYARVSMVDQDPRMQIDALIAHGVPENRIYQDKGSGAKADREGLTLALKALRKGDVFVAWKLDRVARSMRILLDVISIIEAKGAHFRCLTEDLDTTTPSGRMVFHVMGALAEFERALIRERTIAGLAAARARGRVGGRPPKYTEAQKAEALRLVREGVPVGEAARRVKVKRYSVAKWIAQERKNAGE